MDAMLRQEHKCPKIYIRWPNNLIVEIGSDSILCAYSRPRTVEYPDGFRIEHQYHAAGLQARTRDITDPLSPKVLWALGENGDARGGLYRQLYGNGVMTEHTRDISNGRIRRIQSGWLLGNGIAGFSGTIQDLGYCHWGQTRFYVPSAVRKPSPIRMGWWWSSSTMPRACRRGPAM
jgi:hypothetical protein